MPIQNDNHTFNTKKKHRSTKPIHLKTKHQFNAECEMLLWVVGSEVVNYIKSSTQSRCASEPYTNILQFIFQGLCCQTNPRLPDKVHLLIIFHYFENVQPHCKVSRFLHQHCTSSRTNLGLAMFHYLIYCLGSSCCLQDELLPCYESRWALDVLSGVPIGCQCCHLTWLKSTMSQQ